MAKVTLPDGSAVSIAAAYAPEIAIEAASNAAQCVLTLPEDHGITVGQVLEISSGWGRLDQVVTRVSVVSGAAVTLDGVNTSRVEKFPAGKGVGSVRVISEWQEITGIMDLASSGGDQQFYSFSFLEEDGDEKQVPTTRSASSLSYTLSDDPTQLWYPIAEAASDDRVVTAIRFRTKNRIERYYNGYVSLSKIPSIKKGEAMSVSLTHALQASVVRVKVTA